MSDFRVRPYRSTDEGFCVRAWLYGHQNSDYGKRWATEDYKRVGEHDHYWTRHRAVVLRCLREETTVVACDGEDDDILWGFSCVSGPGVLHYVTAHYKVGQELAREVVEALVPGRLAGPQLVTHEQTGLRDVGVKSPPAWKLDANWLAAHWAAQWLKEAA